MRSALRSSDAAISSISGTPLLGADGEKVRSPSRTPSGSRKSTRRGVGMAGVDGSRRRRASAWSLEAESDAADGGEQAGVRRVDVEFLAQRRDVHVERARRPVVVLVPDFLHEQ